MGKQSSKQYEPLTLWTNMKDRGHSYAATQNEKECLKNLGDLFYHTGYICLVKSRV